MNDVTILVNSCDKYEDAWEPFFRLLKIQWPECENYKIVLNTEKKVYSCDFLNVTTVCTGMGLTWSQRLKEALNEIDSELVLCFLEDFFLKSKVSNEAFLEAVSLMKEDKSIGSVGLKYNPKRVMRDGSPIPSNKFISRDLLFFNFRISFMSILWRREWLIKLLREHEDPWEFERYGSVRSKRYEYKMLEINNNENICPCVFDYDVDIKCGHGITCGQWLPKNKELFDEYGISVDFEKLGINYEVYNLALGLREPKTPKTEEKLGLNEKLYNLKKQIKKLRKKIIQIIRKIKSLI